MSVVPLDKHPVWCQIQHYGLVDKPQSWLAFTVYIDLSEGKGWWNMRTHVCTELNLVFLSGHASRSKPREIIVPLSTDAQLSPFQIQMYIEKIKLPEYNTQGLVLGICAPDCHTVYYRVTDGLVLPEPPEVTEWKKYRREEMPQLRRRHVGEQKAMYISQLQQENKAGESQVNKTEIIKETKD